MSDKIHVEMEMDELELLRVVQFLHKHSLLAYDHVMYQSGYQQCSQSSPEAEHYTAVNNLYVRLQDAYDDYVSDEFTAEEEDDIS